MPQIALPWRWRDRPTGKRTLVFASRFDGGGLRGELTLMRHSFRIRRQVLSTPGAIGVSLYANPLRGKYYTYSAWQDEAALREFARSAAHRDGVRALHARGPVNGVLISWWEDAADWAPDWDVVLRRMAAATPGPYAGPDAGSVTGPLITKPSPSRESPASGGSGRQRSSCRRLRR